LRREAGAFVANSLIKSVCSFRFTIAGDYPAAFVQSRI
jgi:hypothetical protein